MNMGHTPHAMVEAKSQEDATLLLNEAERTLGELHASLRELENTLIASGLLNAHLDDVIAQMRKITPETPQPPQ